MEQKMIDRILHILDVQYEHVSMSGWDEDEVRRQIIYYDGMKTMADDILLMENCVTVRNDCGEHDIVKY